MRATPNKTGLALIALIAAPLFLLAPCMFGPRTFVPFDLAQFAPVATGLSAAELAEMRRDQNTDVSEVPFTFLPEWRFAAQELAAGRLPEWNPFIRGGAPLLATAVVGLMYPPNWLLLLGHDPADGLAWTAYFTFVIGGLLMFGFLRATGIAVLPALLGALGFAFAGTLYANAHFYQRLSALVWLPGVLWAIHRIASTAGWRRIPALIGLALTTALTWLAGFPAYAAAVTAVAGIWALAECLRRWREHSPRAAAGNALAIAAPVALGFALAAVQLAPMFAFFPESNRPPDPSAAQIASQSYDPAGLLGYLLPAPFGHPTTTQQFDYWQSPLMLLLYSRADWQSGVPFVPPNFNYVEYTVFPGTLVLLLALAGLWGCRPLRRPLVAALMVLLVLAIAPSWIAPLYELPGLRSVPPMRFLGPAAALVAALAALGLQRLGSGGRRLPLVLAGLSALLAIGCLWSGTWLGGQPPRALLDEIIAPIHAHYTQASPDLTIAQVRDLIAPAVAPARTLLLANLHYGAVAFGLAALWFLLVPWLRDRRAWPWWQALAIAATAAQLITLAHGVSGGRELPHPHDSVIHEFLRTQRDQYADQGGFTVARAQSGPQTSIPVSLPPCTLVPERIRDLNIYTFIDGRSHLPFLALYGPGQLFRTFWINMLPDDERLARPYLDLLGVRYLLTEDVLKHGGQRVGPSVRGASRAFYIYERPSPLPRAFTVPSVRKVDNDDAVIRAMIAPDFQPRAAVWITPEEEPKLPPVAAPSADAAGREVRFERDTPTEIVLSIGDGAAGYLLLSDSYMSGWTATVGDREVPIARADLALRAVPLPAGPVTVKFSYATPGLVRGAAITALGLAVLIALGLVYRARSTPLPRITSPDDPARR